MFNPVSIIASLTQIYGIEWAGAGFIAFGISCLIYSLIHAGKGINL